MRIVASPCTCAIDSSSYAGYQSIPKANSWHTVAQHASTRTPPRNIVRKAIFSLTHFPASFICFWPSFPFDWGGGGRNMAGGWSLNKPASYKSYWRRASNRLSYFTNLKSLLWTCIKTVQFLIKHKLPHSFPRLALPQGRCVCKGNYAIMYVSQYIVQFL